MPETIARKNIIFSLQTKVDDRGVDQLDKRVGGLRDRFRQTKSVFAGIIAANVVQSGIRAIGGLVTKTAELTATAEQSAISFRTLIGNTEEANALLARLNSFSVSTPFEPAQIREAAKTLLGFGIESDKVLENIELIGNASAATGADLNSLALVFGQVAGAGRLNGQDALQFVNQGLPIYQLLSESLGVSIDQVRELQSQGAITFDTLTEAFQKASDEGGKFAGALVAQSTSLSGLLSTLNGVFNDILTRLGTALLPIAQSILPPVIEGLFRFAALVERNAPFIAAFVQQIIGLGRNIISLTRRAISPVLAALGRLVNSFDGVISGSTIFQEVLNRLARASVVFGRVLGFVIDGVGTLIQFFRGNSFGQAIIAPFVGLIDVITNLPAVFNGVIEASKQLGINIQNFFAGLVIDATIAFEKLKGLSPFSDVNQALIDNLEQAKRDVTSSTRGIGEAFLDGFNEINDITVDIPDFITPEDKVAANNQGKELGGEIIDGIDEAITEGTGVVQNSLKQLQQAVTDVQDQLNNTDIDDVPMLTNLTQQLIDAQKEVEQAQLLLEFLERSLSGDFAALAGVEGLDANISPRLSFSDEEIKADTDALGKRLGESLVDLQDNPEFSGSLLSQIFGGAGLLLTTDEDQQLRDSLANASAIAIDSINTILEAQEKATERGIELQKERVDAARELAREGSEEQLKIETDRLNELQDLQERAARRRQQLAALEIAANQAVAISNSIVAITEQAKLPFPANVVAIGATSIALGLQLAAATQSISSAFGSIPAFKDGIDLFRGEGTNTSDSNLVRISNNEGVIDAKTNLLRLRAGLDNKTLRQISEQGLGRRLSDVSVPSIAVSNGVTQSGIGSLEREFKGVRSELQQLRQEMAHNKPIIVNKAPDAEVWIRNLNEGISTRRKLHD